MKGISLSEFGGVDHCVLTDIPDKRVSTGEVLVRVHAAGVSFVDLLVIEGKYQVKPPLPFCPGKEAAGVVVELGEGVKDLAVGDRVMVLVEQGAFAQYVLAKQHQCFVLPDKMNFTIGATFGLSYQTAHFAIRDRARTKSDDTIFVTGAGSGVGLATVELGKAFGNKVLAGVSSSSKGERAKAAGADEIVDLSSVLDRNSVRDQVHQYTGGAGANVVIDVIGGNVFDSAIRSVAWRGRIVVVGFAAGRIPTIKANYLLLKNIEATGLDWSDYPVNAPKLVMEAQDEIFKLFKSNKIGSHVDRIMPFTNFSEAVRLIQDRKVKGRIALSWV
jgi:NADPH2:quinone reductase